MKKSIVKNTKPLEQNFEKYFSTNFMVFAEDVILGEDRSFSIVKMIHAFSAIKLPFRIFKFMVAVEFERNVEVSLKEFTDASIKTELRICGTQGVEQTIQTFTPEPFRDGQHPWFVHRIVCDLSMALEMETEGVYEFRVYGTVGDQAPKLVASKRLPIFLQKPQHKIRMKTNFG